jgi:ferredoxin
VLTITFQDRDIECNEGAILRDVLVDAGVSPHNGRADTINCRGNGTCGTCAVEITGEVSERTRREYARLSVPPHTPESDLRLACQTRVEGDVSVRKYPGFWGQHTDREPEE